MAPPSNDRAPNGWNEWSKFVLKELERLNSCYENLDAKVDSIKEDVVMLKVKAGLWGALGGAIPVIAFILLKVFSNS